MAQQLPTLTAAQGQEQYLDIKQVIWLSDPDPWLWQSQRSGTEAKNQTSEAKPVHAPTHVHPLCLAP